jgi:hypothetical protein
MPPVTIERIQINQEDLNAPKAEKNVDESKKIAPTSDIVKPDESGFKTFVRKWFKVTW